jgi:hypothetical protein
MPLSRKIKIGGMPRSWTNLGRRAREADRVIHRYISNIILPIAQAEEGPNASTRK